MGAADKGLFGDKGVAVFFPVVVGVAGDVVPFAFRRFRFCFRSFGFRVNGNAAILHTGKKGRGGYQLSCRRGFVVFPFFKNRRIAV
jgi:hypothetical protein